MMAICISTYRVLLLTHVGMRQGWVEECLAYLEIAIMYSQLVWIM